MAGRHVGSKGTNCWARGRVGHVGHAGDLTILTGGGGRWLKASLRSSHPPTSPPRGAGRRLRAMVACGSAVAESRPVVTASAAGVTVSGSGVVGSGPGAAGAGPGVGGGGPGGG